MYCEITPFGCAGGRHETRILSAEITKALIAVGASGAGNKIKNFVINHFEIKFNGE